MADKYLIRIVEPAVDSYTLLGKPRNIKKIKEHIRQAENTNKITLKEAKN